MHVKDAKWENVCIGMFFVSYKFKTENCGFIAKRVLVSNSDTDEWKNNVSVTFVWDLYMKVGVQSAMNSAVSNAFCILLS